MFTGIPGRLRLAYWRATRGLARAADWPRLAYAAIYAGLKLNVAYHRLGLSAAAQARLVPGALWVTRQLMRQPYLVKLSDIRWGGRPPGGESRVGSGLGRGLVIAGDWDVQDRQPLDDYLRGYPYSRAVLEFLGDGLPYTSTDEYREIAEAVASGSGDDWRARGCRNEADIARRFEKMREIYRSIESQGYRSQSEIPGGHWSDEIKLFIGRDGALLKQQGGGHHRLAMAKLAGLQSIPVLVIGVHRDWAILAQREFGADIITSVDLKIRRDIAWNQRPEGTEGEADLPLSSIDPGLPPVT